MRLTRTLQNAEVNIESTASKSPKSQSEMERNFLGRSSIKNQSAMEYLMTYGWAILIIAVVLVALFQMGVFNSANFAPKAQPGSCQVFRTTAATSLEGTCNNELPQYVAQFDGASSNINAPSSSYTPDQITINAWIDVSSADISIHDAIINLDNVELFSVLSTGMEYWPDTSNYGFSYTTNFLNGWNFVTAEYNFQTQNGLLFVNGREVATGSSSLPQKKAITQTIIGTWSGVYYKGGIANIQIYNTSLSANDVAALYHEGIGGAPQNTQNLVGWWPLNGNANDYSGNNNNGAATNVIYTGSWTSGYSAP